MQLPEILIIETLHAPGSLARVLTALGDANVSVDDVHALQRDHIHTRWEITVSGGDTSTLDAVIGSIAANTDAKVVGRSDRVFNRHLGGKLRMVCRNPISNLEVLRDVYTPGVARVAMAIYEDPEKALEFTGLGNSVAIVTNGTAVLGLGDIGPVAGLPVMEGKAALFSQLVGLSGIPILIDSKDPRVIINTVEAIAPSFGAIQLEDIGAPECFEIEDALKTRLRKPVMHDDQHGTGVVVLAALLSVTRRVGVNLKDCVVGQIGLGAAGFGICSLLLSHGVKKVCGADLSEEALARLQRMGGEPSDLKRVMEECDVVIATTGAKGLIKPEMVRKGQIILALSNPDPEIEPEVAMAHGALFATDGKVVNNVLGFPGIFKGALDARTNSITTRMLMAAARALSDMGGETLVPDPLDIEVHKRVSETVRLAAGRA